MGWTFTDDATCYVAAARPLLEKRPAEHTIALTNLDNVLAGRTPGGDLFGWYEAGDSGGATVTGAVSRSPGRSLLVSELPPGSERALVAGYPHATHPLLGLTGEPAAVRRLGERWSAAAPISFRELRTERLYQLDQLVVPDAPGAGRRATAADRQCVVGWVGAFAAEAGTGPPPAPELIVDRVERGLGWLWEKPAGEPVAMAFRNEPASGVVRVGPVYTAPSARRRGFGAAVTARCTADALATGADSVVLFTDLSNPTANAIYQSIGYRPLSDRLALAVLA